MTTVTITIKDTDDAVEVEGVLDDPAAIDRPVTPAIIVASYLAVEIENVVNNAFTWWQNRVTAPDKGDTQ